MYDPKEKQLVHTIISTALYLHDKHGSFIFILAVLGRGDPEVCGLNPTYFVDSIVPADDTTEPFLSNNAEFRKKGLSSFMMSLIQVLGFLGYKAIHDDDPTGPYVIPCNERITKKESKEHHLYLQARIEHGAAYMQYVKIGFSLSNPAGDRFRCVDYATECPISSNRPPEFGYYIDDKYQRLLTLKNWVYNVHPPDAEFKNVGLATDSMWTIFGLLPNHYLSSALVTPVTSTRSLHYTNDAYLSLLDCRSIVSCTHPLDVTHPPPNGYEIINTRVDPYLPPQGDYPKMIVGLDIHPSDVRPQLFRNVLAHNIEEDTDAFQAMNFPMYLSGEMVNALPVFRNRFC